jgi:phosphopantothenoylcysteine decarboxylase / phosphopantothenate---cysteine ligase
MSLVQNLPTDLLQGKKVLLGVTGSISAYKSADLARLFVNCGADVRVILTESAKKFIAPLTFETLTGNKVLDDNNEDWTNDFNHIGIGKWADTFIIAPATANTINKLSNGIADNILTSTALAFNKQIVLAPAANTSMLKSPITIASMKLLNIAGYELVDTKAGKLACGDEGEGKLAEVSDIFFKVARELLKEDYFNYRGVVISGGGTIEKIDDVRYLSNFSSGKMANAFALASYLLGADPFFVTTQRDEDLPRDLRSLQVESTEEMAKYIEDGIRTSKKGVLEKNTLTSTDSPKLMQKKPYFFSIAAVSDYTPKFPQEGKLKKEDIGENWSLDLKKNQDILASSDKNGIYTIGFKAEFDEEKAKENASSMLTKKNLDGVCLNILGNNVNFGSNHSQIELLMKDESFTFNTKDKLSLAIEILQKLAEVSGE